MPSNRLIHEKSPYLLIVGPRDAEQEAVSVRARGTLHDLGSLPQETFTETLQREIATRGQVSVLSEHFAEATVGAGE